MNAMSKKAGQRYFKLDRDIKKCGKTWVMLSAAQSNEITRFAPCGG